MPGPEQFMLTRRGVAQRTAAAGLRPPPLAGLIEGVLASVNAFRTGKWPGGASGDHPVYRTLAYGESWQRGPFTCTSRVTGVTCRNRTGHGLFISRQTYRSW
jgi:hypothetical protein